MTPQPFTVSSLLIVSDLQTTEVGEKQGKKGIQSLHLPFGILRTSWVEINLKGDECLKGPIEWEINLKGDERFKVLVSHFLIPQRKIVYVIPERMWKGLRGK